MTSECVGCGKRFEVNVSCAECGGTTDPGFWGRTASRLKDQRDALQRQVEILRRTIDGADSILVCAAISKNADMGSIIETAQARLTKGLAEADELSGVI